MPVSFALSRPCRSCQTGLGAGTLLRNEAVRQRNERPTMSAGTVLAAPNWQRAWLDAYPCDTPSSVPYPPARLSALLEHAARRFPERTACTLYGETLTYADLDDQARRLAKSLHALGARKGRFVGLLLPNIPEYLVALQATWLTGATALQLSPLM